MTLNPMKLFCVLGQLYNSYIIFLLWPTERVSSVVVASDPTDLVEFKSSVRLSCSASGFSPHYFWMNNGSEVTASDRVQITDGGSTLTIAKVTRPDLNLLRCHAFNYFSEDFSDPVNISIFCKFLSWPFTTMHVYLRLHLCFILRCTALLFFITYF